METEEKVILLAVTIICLACLGGCGIHTAGEVAKARAGLVQKQVPSGTTTIWTRE